MNKIENMKSIPIKTYDFKVDFHVGEDDVIEEFLDPNQNKHISIPKRPQSAKTSTWGNPKPLAKQFVTKKAKGPNLTIVGSANTDGEPVQANTNNPLASNIFHFKSHLPVKKLSDNPKLALSMFKKKTLGAKSEQVFRGPPENFNKTTGFNSFNQGVPGVYYENKNSIYAGEKPMMNGLNSGKKLTKKLVEDMKMKKEMNALKSSGAGAGMFQKRLHNGPKRDEEDEEEEEETGEETKGNKQRPQSAITPGYMKSNKTEKVLKAPKKPEFDWEQDEENQAENEDAENEDNNLSKKKPQPQKQAAKKKVKVEEPEEEAPAGDEFNDNNLMNKNEEEEDLGGTENKAPVAKNKRPKEEKAKPMKPLPKRKQKKVGDEDFEEGAEGYDDNDADFEQGLQAEEGEEVFAEDGEYNEEAIEENPNEEEEGGNEENNEGEQQEEENNEEEQASQASSKRRFRSNYANMMSELQGGVLTGEPEATFGFQEAEEDHGDQAAPPPKKGVKETSNRLLGKETKEVKSNNITGAGAKGKFVPYEYINSVDGDTAQMQRQKVTKDVTDFLKAADEKRKRQMEVGTKKKSYIEDNVQDQNEYSDRMEYVNTRVKAKIAAMRNIINGSKATTVQQNQILDVEEINSADSIEDIDDFERYVKK
jgi:hypothetical protein